ncbi:MAG: ion channel [Bacteroidota bacterium]|nr:ion channel [Bacteroidota bacterium]
MLDSQLQEDQLLRYSVIFEEDESKTKTFVNVTFYDENNKKVTRLKLKVITKETIYQLITDSEEINLQNAYVKDLSLSEYRKLSNLEPEEFVLIKKFNAENTFFDCDAITDLSFSKFEGDTTIFSNCVFGNGNANFSYSDFGHGNVYFTSAKFGSGTTNFKSVKFGDGNISFDGTNFGNGNLSFVDANFSNGNVDFKNTIYGKGNVDFKFAKFSDGNISFERASFGIGKKDFKNVEFGGGRIDFKRVEFNDGDVSFEGVEFGNGKVNFKGSVFGKGIKSFNHSDFAHGEAIFDHVDFGLGLVSFNQAKAAHISFRSCPFNSYVDFRFSECKIANLSNTIVRDIIDIKPEHKEINIRELNLTNARILGRIFINWRENKVDKLIYNQKKTDYFQKAEQFRILKENFRVNGQYEDEDAAYIEFKRCEAKANLNSEKVSSPFNKLFAYPKYYFQKYIFDFIGRYGTAPTRVLLNAVFTVFVFGIIYYLSTEYIAFFGSIESTLPQNLNHFHEFWNSIYYSAITFFTIGYGDYFPHGALKFVAALEGFSGVFLMSYFTVAFVRKILR